MVPIVKVAMPDRDLLLPELEKVLYSGMIAEGESVYSFEKSFSEHFSLPTVLGMCSGTAALHAALVLAGVKEGDEVISTPMTAEPTNLAILYTGATPCWADVNPLEGTLDPKSIEDNISSKTKAIIVVHYAGYPARMNEIMEISTKYGIPVIEDCAHALGSLYNEKSIGTFGDYAIFSFQAIKHMTLIDGGALVIKDSSKIVEAKKIRWFGMLKGINRPDIDINSIGYKYNMTNVNAAIGLVQLEGIDKLIQCHINNGKYYDNEFSKINGLSPCIFDKKSKPSYWIYTLLSDDSNNVIKLLNDIDVSASKLHKPNNRHSIFNSISKELRGLDEFYKKLVHIPCGWWVDDDTRFRIVEKLKKG